MFQQNRLLYAVCIIVGMSFLLLPIGGCKHFLKRLTDHIDVDIDIDYCYTDSLGEQQEQDLWSQENVEDLLVW
jgi:hypoxanthine-guanine phosphoribosyltransferase